MKKEGSDGDLFAALWNLVNAMRLSQHRFQERPAAPEFCRMRELEKLVDAFMDTNAPPPPPPADLKGAFP